MATLLSKSHENREGVLPTKKKVSVEVKQMLYSDLGRRFTSESAGMVYFLRIFFVLFAV